MIRPSARGSAEGFGKASKIENNVILAAHSNALPRPPSLPYNSAHTHPVLGVVFHSTVQNVDIVAFDYSLVASLGMLLTQDMQPTGNSE